MEIKKAISRNQQQSASRSWHNSVVNGALNLSRTKKIFIGGLAHTVTENDMRKYFEQFGTITEAIVMYGRGFGFVTFDSEDVVDIVVQMPIHDLNGKMVEVKRAVAKERSSGHIRFPAGNFGGGNGHFFNSTPTPVGGYAPPMNTSYSAAMGGIDSYSSDNFGTGAGYRPAAIPSGGYDNTTFVNNIPSYGPGYGNNTGSSYAVPVAYAEGNAWNLGFYGKDTTSSSVGCGGGGPTTRSGGISHHGVAQADNGQSNESYAGYAAENN